jgi:hypothetical protein
MNISPTGITASASFTPAAAAYTAGDVFGVYQEFSFVGPLGIAVPKGSLIRILGTELRIDTTALVASEGAYTLHLYTAAPTTIADNAPYAITAADLPNYIGSLAVGTPVDLGAALFVKSAALTHDIPLVADKLYGFLINAATITPTAVARQIKLLGAVHA